MTKIKNTKKGMAKKTLSMSLVVAMLATSNVPVWAAEFSDGTDAAVTSEVTAPVVEDTTADVAEEAFTDEAAPEVATEETVAPATTAEVNTDGYTSDFKVTMNDAGWGNPVSVTGTLKDKNGATVTTTKDNTTTEKERITASVVWLVDGREANGSNAHKDLSNTTATAVTDANIGSYIPSRDDFNKNLSLMITVKRGNTVIYQETVDGGVVEAKDISAQLFNKRIIFTDEKGGEITTTQYNGKEQKLVPATTYKWKTDFKNAEGEDVYITNAHISWNYAVEGNDFTNVTDTDKNITVTGTLEGTYDATSDAYGYKATSASKSVADANKVGTYKITALPITTSNLVASMKTTSVEFTGSAQEFTKSDVTLQVKIDDNTKVDITDAIKAKAKFTGATAVGKHTLEITNISDNATNSSLDTESTLLKNFTLPTTAISATTENEYEIVARNLSNCSVESDIELNIDDVKNATAEDLVNKYILGQAGNVTFKGNDGKTFTLSNISSYVTITAEQALVDAIKAGTKGTVNNAVTVTYKADTKNVTGKITVPVRLTVSNLSNVNVYVNGTKDADGNLIGGTSLSIDSTAPTDISLPYIATAYDLEAGKYGIDNIRVAGLKTGEYKLTYNDNVNAGTVKVTVTGLLSYEGSVKNFYFKINPVSITSSNINTEKAVTINADNTADASLYKNAVKLTIKKDLADKNNKKVTTATLEEGTDYTVKYYYTKAPVTSVTEDQAKNYKSTGDNVAGNYVTAIINIKKGNFSADGKTYLAKSVKIEKKKISNVTISLDKSSYTYTGKQIVPEVVVKDGSSVLEKGVDYSVLVKDNVNVGTATVTIKALNGSDYEVDSTATATFEITPAKAEDVVVTLGSSSSAAPVTDTKGNVIGFKYNKGKQIKPVITAVTLNGVNVADQFDVNHLTYGDNNQAGKEMGSITVAPKSGNKNFTGTKTQKFDIKGTELKGTLKVYGSNKKELTSADKSALVTWDAYHFYYNGAECKFADAAFLPSIAAAKEGTDYEIKYINNVNAGYGLVAVVAKGNYEGNLTTTLTDSANNNKVVASVTNGKLAGTSQGNIISIIGFQIKASTFTAKNITVTNGVYASGLPVQPKVTVSVAGKTLVEGTDYKLNIRPQDTDKTFTYPASIINATDGKIFYVDVIPMGGYEFDDVDGSNTFAWGIDKFDFAAADITSSGDTVTVKNGTMTVDPSDYTVTKDEAAGTVTVAAKEGSKNYTGSQTVKVNNVQVQAPVISTVKVVGNKATVILSGESDGASGYDYVISKANDYTTDRVDVTKNQLKTTGDFTYVQQGTYYAYCHAWTRGADGKKIFSGWSNIYPFAVSAITPSQPTITSVKTSGSTVTVTYTKSSNADGYDVVLGTATKKVSGETRPVEYGELVKKNIKGNTVTVTFKNVEKGTYYAGLHAYNRTAEDGKKVFSQWSNVKKVTVK